MRSKSREIDDFCPFKAFDRRVLDVRGVKITRKGQKSVISRPYCPFVHRRYGCLRKINVSRGRSIWCSTSIWPVSVFLPYKTKRPYGHISQSCLPTAYPAKEIRLQDQNLYRGGIKPKIVWLFRKKSDFYRIANSYTDALRNS